MGVRLSPGALPSDAHVGVHFDLDEHERVDERADLDEHTGRADLPEDLAVRARQRLPTRDVGDVEAGADDLVHAGTGQRQRRFDVAQGVDGLGVDVTSTLNDALLIDRAAARDVYAVAGANRTAVAGRSLPGSAHPEAFDRHLRLDLSGGSGGDR